MTKPTIVLVDLNELFAFEHQLNEALIQLDIHGVIERLIVKLTDPVNRTLIVSELELLVVEAMSAAQKQTFQEILGQMEALLRQLLLMATDNANLYHYRFLKWMDDTSIALVNTVAVPDNPPPDYSRYLTYDASNLPPLSSDPEALDPYVRRL
jgi:hypothetical protein